MPDKLLKASQKEFFAIYIGSLVILFSALFYFAFNSQKELLINGEMQKMNQHLTFLEESLKEHHKNKSKLINIHTNGYDLAFADSDRSIIVASHDIKPVWEKQSWMDDGMLFVRHDQAVYFLGIKYIFCSKKIDTNEIIRNLTAILGGSFLFMGIVGYFLSAIALSPARRAFDSIDTFIKHATHDINTPISSILSNAHLLKNTMDDSSQSKIVDRIMLGAKSLHMLYDDLLFLSFDNHDRVISTIKANEIAIQRVVIAELMAEYKKITITTNLNKVELKMSENDLSRLIDNLLSNAIKYNKPNGSVEITLNREMLSVKDDGIGMDEEVQKRIFDRYYRGVSFEKGIGIGMEIVSRVCAFYNLNLEIHSQKQKGSEVVIKWSKSVLL